MARSSDDGHGLSHAVVGQASDFFDVGDFTCRE